MSGLTEPLRHVIPLAEGVEMAFRLIPPGTFRMGSRGMRADEEPVHRVVIAEGFWMGETPVTQAQFRVWTEAVGEKHENQFAGNDDNPAENLHWHQASGYCEWLTEFARDAMPPVSEAHVGIKNWVAALPTEVQWEYACRAGTETEYYTGDGEAALAEAGWFGEELRSGSTHPVRLKLGNAFGLFDMHGNVWEWCADVYDTNAYRKRADPWVGKEWNLREAGSDAIILGSERSGDSTPLRLLRGGCCRLSRKFATSSYRTWYTPAVRGWSNGFRVCLIALSMKSSSAKGEGTAGLVRCEIDVEREVGW